MQGAAPKRKVYIDKQLFERIRQGDQDAFEKLYEITYTPLYAFLLSYTLNREDAQDLLHDIYTDIEKLPTVPGTREPHGMDDEDCQKPFFVKVQERPCRKLEF